MTNRSLRAALLATALALPILPALADIYPPPGGGAGSKVTTSSKTSAYPVVAADSGTHFDNIGAGGSVTFTLPAAAAGLNYCFLVSAAQTVVVAAASGEKIAIGASNSAATGNITATTAFAQACLEAHAASQWVARSAVGTWTVN